MCILNSAVYRIEHRFDYTGIITWKKQKTTMATTYATDIPANAQVADGATAAQLGPPAPDINVKDPIQLNDILADNRELKKRKFAAEKKDALVADDELNQSRRRLIHVSAVQGQREYGGAAPQWATDMQNAMAANFARFSHQRFNAALPGDKLPLRSLQKVHSGLGGPLVGFGGYVPNPPAVAAAVGDQCPIDQLYFPTDMNELIGMDMTRLNRLAMWYNEDFGIVAGDDDMMRLTKFKDWCKF